MINSQNVSHANTAQSSRTEMAVFTLVSGSKASEKVEALGSTRTVGFTRVIAMEESEMEKDAGSGQMELHMRAIGKTITGTARVSECTPMVTGMRAHGTKAGRKVTAFNILLMDVSTKATGATAISTDKAG